MKLASSYDETSQPSPSPSPSPSPIATGGALFPKKEKDEEKVLECLNESAGAEFRAIESNLKLIRLRMQEHSATPDDVIVMLRRQAKLWKGTDMEQYLRPSTLFGKEKFAQYFGARKLPVTTTANGHRNGHGQETM